MTSHLHITHRAAYLRGREVGKRNAEAGRRYSPPDLTRHGDTDEQRAYALGYADGWAEGNPCDNGTCGHLAHQCEA